MNHQTLKSFIDLVTFDQHLIQLQKEISDLQIEIEKNNQKKIADHQQLDLLVQKKNDLQKAIHAQELMLYEYQDQEQRLSKNIATLSSPKEYNAAVKEMDHLRLNRTVQEQKLTQLTSKLQLLEKEHVAATLHFQELLKHFNEQSDLSQKKMELLQQQVQSFDLGRIDKVVGIPTDWMSTYELMRGRVADPVVPLLQDSCSVCFYAVTPRDLQLIKKSAMIQCKDCYRFLYEAAVA